MNKENTSVWIGKVTIISLVILALVATAFLGNNLFERVDAGEIVVIQSVFGNMTVYTAPGIQLKLFGKATHYKKSFQFWFSKMDDQGSPNDDSIHIRFNDGGLAKVSGSVRVDLPSDDKEILDLHNTYGTQIAVEQQLVRTNIERSVFMTGPLMSSKESYAEKRNDLISFIEDQAANGVFRTQTRTAEITDLLTGEKKQVPVVDVVRSDAGVPEREEISPLTRFGVHLYNMSINSVDYDPVIDKQIAAQQEATMQVQTAIANSKKAEQEALTVAKQGEADAAKAEWEQKAINAKLVAEATGKMMAAEQEEKAAEFTRQKTIALAEGEAEAKRLLAQANNSLNDRLSAYTEVNKAYAEAIANMRVPMVPAVVMGGSGGAAGSSTNSVTDLINMLQVKTAKDLALNLDMTPGVLPPMTPYAPPVNNTTTDDDPLHPKRP